MEEEDRYQERLRIDYQNEGRPNDEEIEELEEEKQMNPRNCDPRCREVINPRDQN
jgi:hypothetical protein